MCRWLKSVLVEDDLFILYSQYRCCWWPDCARSQGISSHVIDLVPSEHYDLITRGTNSWNPGNACFWLWASSSLIHVMGLLPAQCQAMLWISVLSVEPLGSNFNEISTFTLIDLKMLFTKWLSFCSSLNLLNFYLQYIFSSDKQWLCGKMWKIYVYDVYDRKYSILSHTTTGVR